VYIKTPHPQREQAVKTERRRLKALEDFSDYSEPAMDATVNTKKGQGKNQKRSKKTGVPFFGD
jgi:hypothetical protein